MPFQKIKDLFHITQPIGYTEADLYAVCQKWHGMPLILKQYYLELGKHTTLNHAQNDLCKPHKLMDAKDYIIFYMENQCVSLWAIKKSDWQKDNPPVYCANYYVNKELHFQLESETLTDFLHAMALFQASMGLTYSTDNIYIVTEEQANQIRKKYKKYPYELKTWLSIQFYGNHADEVISLDQNNDEYDLMYASESKEHFTELNQFINTLNLEPY